MKTAISIPDHIFKAAEKVAKELKTSRSELYAKAVQEYIDQYNDTEITRKLNEVYDHADSSLDPVIAKLQARSLPKDHW